MDPSADITLKTYVNTRAPLASRVPKKKSAIAAGFPNISLHHSKETTYDIDYNPWPLPPPESTLRYGSGKSWDASKSGAGGLKANGEGGAGAEANCAGAAVATGCGSETGSGSGLNGSGSGLNGSGRGCVGEGGEANGVTANCLGSYKTISYSPITWESEAHSATRNIQPEQQLDFYSNVRKIEARDDELRGGRVGHIQRSVEIAAKRATDPQMRQLPARYEGAEVTEYPIVAAHEKLILKRNYLDLVECQHLDPDTEQQIGFNAEPQTRLPRMDLSQEHPVQSKAITRMGTSEELFRGYPKYVNDKPVSYAGHIPMHPRNLDAIHGGEDCRREYAKSTMTLATHGGGVDTTVSANNIKARMRRGKNAPAIQMLKPKNDNTIRETTEGNMMQATLYDTTEKERRMNVRNDKRGHLYF